MSVGADGAFSFATAIASGSTYAVTVQSQPAGQTCSIAGGTGTIGAGDVTSVAVDCTADAAAPAR